ncbi:SPOR domain-containing protein [Thiorhodovibrio frisius]|uniref:Cell division protein n=1 Tax=Thiorhodovibrio frisius TaxID=631362 RepID=H8YZ49_9GAMM|nr:SPOR domain-containing protein [Thiorhodovibrio frisius]EIC21976.1 cell division protein [Thiorhodovibrio frisius]WPL24265.1 cell division protein FtsN [Thiorhodovibrio frisius]
MAKTATRSSPSSRKRDRPQSTGAFWFLLGSLVGAFGMGLAWMRHDRLPTQPARPSTAQAPTPKPTFDFYERLRQEEVLVPVETPVTQNSPLPPPTPKPASEAATTQTKPAAQNAPTASPASTAKYRLQVGSFRDLADAERRKAELALMGFSVNIVEAEVGGAKTYRLRSGQYDKAGADALGKKLQAQGVSSMAVRDN